MSKTVEEHGWTAVPRSRDKLLDSIGNPKSSKPMKIEDIPLPDSPLVQSVLKYAKENLTKQTFNHSMRVFYYGQAITTQHFPEWRYSPETYLLTALLHDIGTTDHNISSTQLSFEFFGGVLSLDLLKQLNAPQSQAEAVAEAIIRHQDLGETGMHTTIGAVTHFATVFDNAGLHPELVHKDTIENVVAKFPRDGWTGCFATVVRKEVELKPWSHTTKIEGFAEMVEANKLMEPYD